MKDLSWIDEAWQDSQEIEQQELLITIEQYYEYVKNRENNGADRERRSSQQGQI
jgi:hypothetical protein